MIFFHSVPHSPSVGFISAAFTPVNQMFTGGGGEPGITRRALFFLLLDFGMWGSLARRRPLESRAEKMCSLGKSAF